MQRVRPWLLVVPVALGLGIAGWLWLNRGQASANWPELKPAAAALKPARIKLGPNVHVSSATAAAEHMGCALATDPTNPRRLFVASTLGDGYDDIVGYNSDDGGATWNFAGKRPHRPDEQVADEEVAFGPDGGLFFVNMRVPRSSPGRHRYGTVGAGYIDLAYSSDGGKTWEERASIARYIDRPCLAVDGSNSSSRGRLYVHANVEEPVLITSADAGKTFSNSVPMEPTVRSTRPSNPVVLADGAVLVTSAVFVTGADGHLELPLWRSAGGGHSFRLVSANLAGRWNHPRIKSSSVFDVFYPRLAADLGSPKFSGRVYCVWRDGHGLDESYILFATSYDDGATWSVPGILSEQPAGADAGPDYGTDIPAIAVNQQGVVAVSWYDRRGLPKHVVGLGGVIPSVPGYNARIRVSLDGGKTWTPSLQMNATPIKGNLEDARYWTGLAAAADGRFHAAWIGDATGKRQVWATAIEVGPTE